MNQFSMSENSFTANSLIGPNNYSISNGQHAASISEKTNLSNNAFLANNNQYSKKYELEKLFSHATEVKGDLESVIHALVGIIGNGSKESALPVDTIQLETEIKPQKLLIDEEKNNNSSTNFYNRNWPNDNAPSVNVENVLKNVRANKIKNDKFQLYENGQSSTPSKERFIDKLDLNLNLQKRKMYKESFRSMLSDPGHIDQCKLLNSDLENPRKHKSQYPTLFKDAEDWSSTDVLFKKIKSVKTSNDERNEIPQVQLENDCNMNEVIVAENNHIWSGFNTTGNVNQFTDRNKFNWSNTDISNNGVVYRNLSNRNWSTGSDLINESSNNIYIDDTSCSSWSKLSSNNALLQSAKIKQTISIDGKYDKQTPSVSVSDSEGSTEPVRDPPVKKIPRLPSLCTQLRSKQGKYEIILLNQPEQQHRARYMTEGSRGAVKDRTGNGYPTIQLIGWKQSATLQIFVGSEEGRVKPHNFYQACKVSGKQILSCKERMFDNAGLIEVQLEAKENQTVMLDCIGILKLRNVDVERRGGVQRIKHKSTMARLVFRVNLPHGDGYFTCLQVTSDPILCTQPVGTPEISKMSLSEGSCKGNMELFIIGKNIVKNSRVLFQDYSEHRGIIWQSEAKIDTEYLQQTHLICVVPPFCDEKLKTPQTVQIVLNCSGRLSEPRYFTYLPDIENTQIFINKPFKFPEWKIEKTDFSDDSPFPIETRSINLDVPNHAGDSNIIKSTNDILYELEYLKSNDNPINTEIFGSISNEDSYQQIYSLNKNQPEIPINTQMNWIPCTISNDIPITIVSSPYERFSNSLDSNIENDCILHDNHSMQVQQPEPNNNFSKSNEILSSL